jgi:hypothetical protein
LVLLARPQDFAEDGRDTGVAAERILKDDWPPGF